MEAKLFLKNKLQELVDKFENLKLSYFFDNSYSQHVIVVTPSNIYSDDVFAKEQVNLEIDFINNFPYESLYFVEKENIEIASEFEFECHSSHQNHLIFNELSENVLAKLLVSDPTITISASANNYSAVNVVNAYKIVNSSIDDLLSQPSEIIQYGEENSYAMAAQLTMEESKKTNNQIKLESILLIKSNFSRDLIIDAHDKTKVTQDVNINISNSDLKSDKFAVYLHVDFVIYYDGKTVVKINTTQAGSFDKTNTDVDDKTLESFIDINAPAIIFPFVREEIAVLSSKAGIGTVLLQPVNFVELSKKKKNSNTTD